MVANERYFPSNSQRFWLINMDYVGHEPIIDLDLYLRFVDTSHRSLPNISAHNTAVHPIIHVIADVASAISVISIANITSIADVINVVSVISVINVINVVNVISVVDVTNVVSVVNVIDVSSFDVLELSSILSNYISFVMI